VLLLEGDIGRSCPAGGARVDQSRRLGQRWRPRMARSAPRACSGLTERGFEHSGRAGSGPSERPTVGVRSEEGKPTGWHAVQPVSRFLAASTIRKRQCLRYRAP